MAIYCELSAALLENSLAPFHVDVRCPAILQQSIRTNVEWSYGAWRVSGDDSVVKGQDGGAFLVRQLGDSSRPLPIIVVSSQNGLTLQKGIAASIANDLAGLATVVQADDEAMWQVSRSLGREWSCYLGAIRLYWPLPIPGSNPAQHPLWTASRLLDGAFSVDEAAGRLRNYLRRRLMAVSVFAVAQPECIGVVESERSLELRDEEIAKARSTNDWEELAEASLRERDEWKAKTDASERQNDILRERVYQQQMQATLTEVDTDDQLQPDQPPATIMQAVQQAKLELIGKVVFGRDVERGLNGLKSDAGPPQKVLEYLRALGYMVEERRKGSLSNSIVAWLVDMGVTSSGESETDRKNTATMKRRQWHDGTKVRQFEFHLKPNDNLSPDRCVRIYFDWDDATRQVVVGWIDRHPD
ncbi:MAG: hypothetical protein Q7R30_20610 [Acidobacteriota bacterium]|nr:hypothetical protein [Acidobacteriota bacterium]